MSTYIKTKLPQKPLCLHSTVKHAHAAPPRRPPALFVLPSSPIQYFVVLCDCSGHYVTKVGCAAVAGGSKVEPRQLDLTRSYI